MSDFEGRIDKLEIAYGVKKEEEIEPTSIEEWYQIYPDYTQLIPYHEHMLWKTAKEISQNKKREREDTVSSLVEALHTLETEPKYLNDKKLQRAIKCREYHTKLTTTPEDLEEIKRIKEKSV